MLARRNVVTRGLDVEALVHTEFTVDLESQVVHLPGDEDLPFDVDPFSKVMLLQGTDDSRREAPGWSRGMSVYNATTITEHEHDRQPFHVAGNRYSGAGIP